jgi:hypothetical protein
LEVGLPSYRVAAESLSLAIYDVVGQDGGEPAFIGHTGLAKSAGSQTPSKIPVLDMGPPLHGQDDPGHIKANVVGSAALTDDEVQKIRTFIDRHVNEHLVFQQFKPLQLMATVPKMYCVYPHAEPFYENDGRYSRMRFSCAGFVLEAYKKARINLLDPNSLPLVDIAVIRLGYPTQVRLMDNRTVSREDLGLAGDGPWPVLLCGYLFHALNRDGDAIRRDPYVPNIADRRFI